VIKRKANNLFYLGVAHPSASSGQAVWGLCLS